MKDRMGLTGEAWDHKVAGIFRQSADLRACQERLVESFGLSDGQVSILGPGDHAEGKVLEPESRGIWHTLIRAHLWLALAGAIIGAVAYFLLIALDVPFVARNALASFMLLVAFCTIGGLMIGGLVTLRPDHSPYIVKVREALRAGRHVLLVHATDREQMNEVQKILQQRAEDTVSTF